jgi:hypothetical protein
MADVVLWIYNHQIWLYCGLATILAWQLWALWRAHRLAHRTVFNIELEKYLGDRQRALTLLFLLAALLIAVVLASGFLAPNLTELLGAPATPTAPRATDTPEPTITPELILPGLESPTVDATSGPTPTRTPVPAGGSNCQFPLATIRSPIPGAILAGKVEIRGTANIQNFAFYVIEVSTLGNNWLSVVTSPKVTPAPSGAEYSQPVIDGVLGVWDTSLQQPGDFALRLTVYDSAGNSLPACTIPITIQAPAPTVTPTPP